MTTIFTDDLGTWSRCIHCLHTFPCGILTCKFTVPVAVICTSVTLHGPHPPNCPAFFLFYLTYVCSSFKIWLILSHFHHIGIYSFNRYLLDKQNVPKIHSFFFFFFLSPDPSFQNSQTSGEADE